MQGYQDDEDLPSFGEAHGGREKEGQAARELQQRATCGLATSVLEGAVAPNEGLLRLLGTAREGLSKAKGI